MRQMKTILCVLFLVFSAVASSGIATQESENTSLTDTSSLRQLDSAFRFNIQGWTYVYIEGEPFERGFQHGSLLASEINQSIENWASMIHNHPAIKPFSSSLSEKNYNLVTKLWWRHCKEKAVELYADKFVEFSEYRSELLGITAGMHSRGVEVFGHSPTYEDILTNTMMYEVLSKIAERRTFKNVDFWTDFYDSLVDSIDAFASLSLWDFINDSFEPDQHKCSGFGSAGDATGDDSVVVCDSIWSTDAAYAWWWSYWLCSRWNIILDINPSEGSRLLMSSAPGYIWSDHDFYENENGLAFIETTVPQGFYDTVGLPLAIRARLAAQYAESVDDVISYLTDRSDGSMNAVWLIIDANSGELVRLDAGYRFYSSWSTVDGFEWSANNPKDLLVRLERVNIYEYLRGLAINLVSGRTWNDGLGFTGLFYKPESRDIAFEQWGNEWYGSLDVERVKEIMSTEPVSSWSGDCKLTDSELLKNLGLWAIMGNPGGTIWDLEKPGFGKETADMKQLPISGWVRLFGMTPKDESFSLLDAPYSSGSIWNPSSSLSIGPAENDYYANAVSFGETIVCSDSDGKLSCINPSSQSMVWKKEVGLRLTTPVVDGNRVFVGSNNGVYAYSSSGSLLWQNLCGRVVDEPCVVDDVIVVSVDEDADNGKLLGLSRSSGQKIWSKEVNSDAMIASSDSACVILNDDGLFLFEASSGNLEIVNSSVGGLATASSLIVDELCYLGLWDSKILCVNLSSKEVMWQSETGWGIDASPTVFNDMVFVGGLDHNLYCLNRFTGQILWVVETLAAIHGDPVIFGSDVVVGSDDGRLYCIDTHTGNVKKSFAPGLVLDPNLSFITTPIVSDPVVINDALYFGALGMLYKMQ